MKTWMIATLCLVLITGFWGCGGEKAPAGDTGEKAAVTPPRPMMPPEAAKKMAEREAARKAMEDAKEKVIEKAKEEMPTPPEVPSLAE
jgi:hypothetical protein